MRSVITAGLAAAALVLGGAPAWSEVGDEASYALRDRDLSVQGRLEDKQRDLAWEMSHPQTKGVRRLVILERQQELERVIDDIESGRPVDPAILDSMLDEPLIGPGLSPAP